MPDRDPSPFDPAPLRAEVGGDEAVVRDLARMCLEELPKQLAEIRRAVERNDSRGLKIAAHALKGTVANFGAIAVCEAAWRLECLDNDASIAGSDEGFRQLEHEIHRIEPLLAALSQGGVQ